MRTSTPKPPAPSWTLIDAEGQALGRIAAVIAHRLRGKHRATFAPHQLCGDHVVVVNAAKIAVSQRKLLQKLYYKHSGYFGHLRTTSLEKILQEHPDRAIEMTVRGMLRKNRLRPQMLKRLHIFPAAEHPYAAQKPASVVDRRLKAL